MSDSQENVNSRDGVRNRFHQNRYLSHIMGTSLDDFRSLNFWKAVFAEFLGTFILVLLGVGSAVQGWEKSPQDVVQIALAFGLSVASAIWIIGHISGGHINPAVTWAMFITRKISLLKTILFFIVQSLAGICAAGLIYSMTPPEIRGTLGCTMLGKGMTAGQGFGVEFFITFILVLTVFATCDVQRKDLGGSFPLSIGLSVTLGHLWAVQYTGSSMNPARSLGPAVVMEIWDDHWIYWMGPLVGATLAGLLYEHLLAKNASMVKARNCLMTAEYDHTKFRGKPVKITLLEDTVVEPEPLPAKVEPSATEAV